VVSVVKTDLTNISEDWLTIGVGVPIRYSKRWWFAVLTKAGNIVLVDIANKTATKLTQTQLNRDAPRLIDYSLQGSKLKLNVFGFNASEGKVKAVEYVVDMSALTLDSATELWSKTSTDDPDIVNQTQKGTVIGKKFILYPPVNKPYVFYLDAKTGDIIAKYDTGFNGYNPRLDASKAVVRPDDIYMVMGRHLAGDNFRIFKVYAKSLTTISGSSPDGDSPHPHIGTPAMLYRKTLLTGTGTTVVSTNPPIMWFDDDLNLVGTTDLSGVSGYSYPHPYGFHVVGLDDQSRIVVVATVGDNYCAGWTKSKILVLAVSTTTYSATKLYEVEYTDRCVIMQKSWYSDRLHVPLVDRDRKKIYAFGSYYTTASCNSAQTGMLLEIDLSDLNIVDWNQYAFYTDGKVPAILDLSVQRIA